MTDDDLALALSLQAKFEEENLSTALTQESSNLNEEPTSDPRSIVDPALELLDPHPDIRRLFQEFNYKYFWGKLSMVEVKWSPRMTLCAGVCSYEGRGGLCSIRLSEPLLKLRPRKDLVETLLHEMIHALLFVTENNTDHDGHGENFCKHMYRINKETGSNITIYHNFHDEVNEMRKHWWRCDGTCRGKRPFYGYVRRAMNRAPAPRDPWWAEHQRTCGGTFIKVKEPENFKKKIKVNNSKDAIPSSSKPPGNKDPGGTSDHGGHRLGGKNTEVDRSMRGIPGYSRLLKDSRVSSTPRISEVSKETSSENRENVKNRSLRQNGRPASHKKSHSSKQPTIKNVLARMKQSGRQSVNAGAPAFKTCKTVSKFSSKASLQFEDSENDSQGSVEGEKINSPHRKEIMKNQGRNESNFTSKRLVSAGNCSNSSDSEICHPTKKLKIDTDTDYHSVGNSLLNTVCPICSELVRFSLINNHVDECLSLKAIQDSNFC